MYFEYEYGEYNAGGTYIAAIEDEELYDDVSVCLVDYGIFLPDNQIAIPIRGDYGKYIDDLSKKVIRVVEYGPFNSEAVGIELKDNWKEFCICINSIDKDL